jgi:hypothetical protein
MFPAEVYTEKWLGGQRKTLAGCDPGLLEKCVYALTLLGHLAESGLPFMFKGGTSMLLHINPIRRLSIDIDIVSPASAGELDRVVAAIGRMAPFVAASEDDRGPGRGLPQRRHFRFNFKTPRAPGGEAAILLDVVMETHLAHETVQLPIRTAFLQPDREIKVTLPTIESLLGDKLTAFAPNTTGVMLRAPDGTAGNVMQVAKQLFDVGILFEHVTDFGQIARVYDAVHVQESGYRGNKYNRPDALTDTFISCLGLCALRQRDRDSFPDTALLQDGFRKLRGHLAWQGFGEQEIRLLAARAAFLAANLRAGADIDFPTARYTGTPGQQAALSIVSLKGHPQYAWAEGIKAVNPEAYHYLHRAISAMGTTVPQPSI